MRKVTFGGAISLDNFIARPDGAVDWIMWSDEAGEIMKDYWSGIDTIVMGRKTYDFAMQNAPKSKKKRPGTRMTASGHTYFRARYRPARMMARSFWRMTQAHSYAS